MARNRLWGWRVAVAAHWLAVLMLVYSMIDDGWRNIDSALVTVTAVSFVPAILLLLPGVRRFYWGKHYANATAGSA